MGAAVVEAGDLLADPLGLVVLVLGVVADDRIALAGLGPQVLGLAAEVVGDDGVGGVEHGLRRPVVLHQRDGGDVRERLLEVEDVRDVGAAELVDALVAVADDRDVAVLGAELDDELVLDPVGVLVLVDQDVGEALAVVGQHLGVAAEQLGGLQEDVVEVHRPGPQQAGLVLAVDLGQLLLGEASGPVVEVVDEDVVVLGRRDLGVDRAGRHLLGVEVEVAQHVAGEADGVGLVVDRERRRVPEGLAVAAQDAHTGRVERRHPHLLRHRPDERRDPRLHLVGGLVGEGDGHDLERAHALLADQPGDAAREHSGLARTGAGEHEQGAAGVDDRLLLRRVQTVEQGIAERPRLRCFRPREELVGAFGHRSDPTGGR